MRSLLALSALLLASTPLLAAERPAEARAKIVAPFLDAQTIAVARINVTRVEPDALIKRLSALTKLDEGILAKDARALVEWKKQFVDAGGKEVFLVLSLADLPQSCLVVVPLAVGKDDKPLAALFRQVGMPGLERRGDAVGFGTEATLKRLRDLKPDPRPDLARAFEALGDNGDAEIVLLPPTTLRRAIDEAMPKLPPEVGGSSTKLLTAGLRWAGARVKLAPKAELEIIVQTKDADTARSLRDVTRRALEQAVKLEDIQQWLPKGYNFVALLAPAVQGDRLIIKVNEEQLLTADVLGSLIAARRRTVDRTLSLNNLKQIGLAMHLFLDRHHAFPPAFGVGKNGKPQIAWRVLILPFIDQDKLYKEFKMDEPWDSEHNKKLIAKMPDIFRTPGAKNRPGFTSYLGVVGKDAMFTPEGRVIAIKDVTDGTSNTIFVVEADDDHAVEWTKPVDLTFDADKPAAGIRAAFNAVFVDGSARHFPKMPDAKTLKAFLTRNGGEVIQWP